MGSAIIAWCGIFFFVIGLIQKIELMLVMGVLLLAIDYSADRVIEAINKRGA